MKDQATTSTELALPEANTLKEMFSQPKGIDEIVSRIEADVRSEAPDLETKKGRDRIKSLAYKVAQSKTALDKAGKELNDETRKKLEKVDAQRRDLRTRLDNLKDEVRKPLEDWQDAENNRVEAHKARLRGLDVARVDPAMSSGKINALIEEVSAISIGPDWEEFQEFAQASQAECLSTWAEHLAIATDREEQAAELERLKAELAERDRQAEEERQRIAAQEAERLEKEAAERREQEAIEAEQRRKEDMARAAAEAHERAQKAAAAEAERVKQEHEQQLAEAKRREEHAAEMERLRLTREREEEERARAKREADKAHRARIKSEITEALSTLTHDEIPAALMSGQIPHVRILI